MRLILRALPVACLIAIPAVGSSQVCTTAPPGAGTRFYIERVAATAQDSTVAARLCLAAGAKGVGSYMATITYDSTVMRALRVNVTGGMQVANSRVAGTIRIAGASPAGFANGQLLLVTFKPSRAKELGRLALSVNEASAVGSGSVSGDVKTRGWPPAVAGTPKAKIAKPVVDSISPRAGEVGPERVTDLVLYGRGFAPSGNVVQFDGAEVTGLLSESDGTVIRFAAPAWIPARGGAPAHRVGAGRVRVQVKHAGGVSNAVTFVVRGEVR